MAKSSSRFLVPLIILILTLGILSINGTQKASAVQYVSLAPPVSSIVQDKPAEIQKCYDFLNQVMAEVGYVPSKQRNTDSGAVTAEGPISCNLNWWGTDADGNSTTGLILELIEYAPSSAASCTLASEEYNPDFIRTMTTFHGNEARILYLSQEIGTPDHPKTHEINSLTVCMYEWGRNYRFRVYPSSSSVQLYGNAPDPFAISEIMYGLMDQYLPLRQTVGMVEPETTQTAAVGIGLPNTSLDDDASQPNNDSAMDDLPGDQADPESSGPLHTGKLLTIGLVAAGALVVAVSAVLLIVKASSKSGKGKAFSMPPTPPQGQPGKGYFSTNSLAPPIPSAPPMNPGMGAVGASQTQSGLPGSDQPTVSFLDRSTNYQVPPSPGSGTPLIQIPGETLNQSQLDQEQPDADSSSGTSDLNPILPPARVVSAASDKTVAVDRHRLIPPPFSVDEPTANMPLPLVTSAVKVPPVVPASLSSDSPLPSPSMASNTFANTPPPMMPLPPIFPPKDKNKE